MLGNFNNKLNPRKLHLRPASKVMRLSRMGAFHQSRLSFARVLLRNLKNQKWSFDRPIWNIDHDGVGVASYRAIGPARTYTLVAFGHKLDDGKRSDRVIAEAWDSTFVLCDGEVDENQIHRLISNVPLQEAGRISENEIILSRANKSMRLFNHVRECLANGFQPDLSKINEVGYLMRTTAVYGAGKFGAADLNTWHLRPEFSGSFQPEMLAVWLIRAFSVDLVEHMAVTAAPTKSVKLNPLLRRNIGVGNSTGLGMAPFLINHPVLIHSWVYARETALARIRALNSTDPITLGKFINFVRRAKISVGDWSVTEKGQSQKIERLKVDLVALSAKSMCLSISTRRPWDHLYKWGELNMSLEGQEALVSILFEPHGEIVDDLATNMSADETALTPVNGHQTITSFLRLLTKSYDWALKIDFEIPENRTRLWYISEEKLEPRLGNRFKEPLDGYEQPLAPAYAVSMMHKDLLSFDINSNVGQFLVHFPQHRQIARRVQKIATLDYAEIRDNTISENMTPTDLLRCKLSFLGATKFNPLSDRWLRINMYQGMPFPDELAFLDPDDSIFPQLK